jgi:hypothetical protein
MIGVIATGDFSRRVQSLARADSEFSSWLTKRLDSIATQGAKAGDSAGKGHWEWTAPVAFRRVLYRLPWQTRFLESGRHEYIGGERRKGYGIRSLRSGGNKNVGTTGQIWKFQRNGKLIFSTKLGAMSKKDEASAHVEWEMRSQVNDLHEEIRDWLTRVALTA